MATLPEQHPDVYDRLGLTYTATRRPDPRIEAQIHAALDGCIDVVNVGAGTGSYEDAAARVIAVEPSREMLARRAVDAAPAIRAVAEALPFADNSFDAAMAVLTVHHWRDWKLGLREMLRVARRRLLVLTHMPTGEHFWLLDYFPEISTMDEGRMPTAAQFSATLPTTRTEVVAVPRDCADGFLCAWWARPEAYLEPVVRAGISSFASMDDVAPRLAQLRADIVSGRWAAQNAALLERDQLDFGYRLIIADLD
jgi:SAM-dependent methyltransferase